jgi:hypothetical protein
MGDRSFNLIFQGRSQFSLTFLKAIAVLHPIFKGLTFLPDDLEFNASVDLDIFGKYNLENLKIRSAVEFSELVAYGESLNSGTFDINLSNKILQFKNFDAFKDSGNVINSSFMESYYMPLLPVNFDFKAAFNYLPNKDKVFNTLYKQGDLIGIDNVEKYLERYISDKDFWKNWKNLKVDNKDKLPKKLTKTLSLKQIIDIQEKYDIEIIDDDKLLEDKYLIEILRNLHYPIFEQKFERIKFKLDFNRILKTPGKYHREINLIPIQIIDLSNINQHIKDIFIKNTDLRIMFEKTDELTITKDTYLFWLRFFKDNFDLILA